MANAASNRESAPKKDLVVSVGAFDGFRWKNGRLSLGWVSFASAPGDLEGQLKRAVDEIGSLKAELDRVAADGEQRLLRRDQENQDLKAQLSRISSVSEQKLALALAEIARLQALLERVASGVR